MRDAWRARAERPFRTNRTPLIVLALVALATGGIWTVQAITTTDTYDEIHVIDRRIESGEFSYAAPVPAGTPGYANGTVLGMDQPGYFTTLTPELDIGFVWRMMEPDTMRTGAHITLRIVGTPDGAPAAIWEHVLDTETFPPGNAGERRVLGRVNMPEAENSVHAKLEAQGRKATTIHWRFVADVTWVGDIGGERATGNTTYTLPFTLDTPLVVLPQGADTTRQVDHGRRVVTTHSNLAGASALIADPKGPIAFGVGSAVIALAAWTLRPATEAAAARPVTATETPHPAASTAEPRQEETVIR